MERQEGPRHLRHDRAMTMTHIYLNPIRTDRVAAFEEFLVKVQEAVAAQRPDLEGRWQALKATEAGDITTYAFIFDGGDLEADWELETLMPAHYGADEANRLMREAEKTYAPFRQWVATLGDHDDDDMTQIGWTFAPHPL